MESHEKSVPLAGKASQRAEPSKSKQRDLMSRSSHYILRHLTLEAKGGFFSLFPSRVIGRKTE